MRQTRFSDLDRFARRHPEIASQIAPDPKHGFGCDLLTRLDEFFEGNLTDIDWVLLTGQLLSQSGRLQLEVLDAVEWYRLKCRTTESSALVISFTRSAGAIIFDALHVPNSQASWLSLDLSPPTTLTSAEIWRGEALELSLIHI